MNLNIVVKFSFYLSLARLICGNNLSCFWKHPTRIFNVQATIKKAYSLMADQGIHSPGGFWVGKFQCFFLRKASIFFLFYQIDLTYQNIQKGGSSWLPDPCWSLMFIFSAQLFFSIKESWPLLDNCQIFYIFSSCFLAKVLNVF